MESLTDVLTEARAAWRRGDWHASRAAYVRVDALGPLPLDDLDAFATSTWVTGHGHEAARLTERAYDRLVRTDPSAAARKAVDVALVWQMRGHEAVARGWADRARTLLVRDGADGVAGYLAYLEASAAAVSLDRAVLAQCAAVLRDNAIRTADDTLAILGEVVAGLSALVDSREPDGMRILDAVLLPVIDERVPLEWAGDVYRTVLGPLARLVDDAHVAAWSQSLRRWRETRGIEQELARK